MYQLSDAATFVSSGGNPQTTPGTGTDAVVSDSLTTAADGLLIGVSFDIGQVTRPNLGSSPMTTCGETGTLGRCGYKTTAGAGPTTITFTETEAFSNTVTMAAAFSPAGGGGAETFGFRLRIPQ